MPRRPARTRPRPRPRPIARPNPPARPPYPAFARSAASALALALASALALAATPPPAAAAPDPTRNGAPTMSVPAAAPLLLDYFDAYLRDQDIEAFRLNVMARYTEGTLARLARSPSPRGRRAAVLALGLVGSFEVNAAVARALRDEDATVRDLANNALWAIWFRADSAANNATLEEVHDLNNRGRHAEAEALATRLIERAPKFAEAYNQRAISRFFRGRFADSAADCRRALERNPYHIGALAGLGQCYLRLDRRDEALATFRRALKLQPFSEGLRETVQALEAD